MTDEDYMRRAIRLAMRGRGTVEPNPSVGCVIVKDGRVIGEGYTQPFGGAHAEPTALAACTESPVGATAYVTLEPCCHTNKKTPPCTPRVIEAGIKRVVYGCLDPNPDVNGKGVAMLRAAGVRVDGPVLEAKVKQQIAPFIAGMNLKRPYVTVKWAQSADEKIAGPVGSRLQISNDRSSRLVHELRARCDAILVGISTARHDDPLLTVRDVPASRVCHRVLLDPGLNISRKSRLVTTAAQVPLIVFCSDAAFRADRKLPDRVKDLQNMGVIVKSVEPTPDDRIPLSAVMSELWTSAVTHLLVEPGPTLAASFFRDNLCDRLWVFRSPKTVNDPTAPVAAAIPQRFVETGRLDVDGDTLVEFLNPESPVFFAAAPSADFVIAADPGGRSR